MPHLRLEYSANLDGKVDVKALCSEIRSAALATGLFEEGGVRVRAVRCEVYAIADDHPDNAFVDLVVRIGEGRSAEARRDAGAAIFSAAEMFLAPLLKAPHFALSLELREIDPRMSWKRNAIHPRLRKS